MNYFTPERDKRLFFCPCCGKQGINPELINKLNIARDLYGKPMVVSSGIRCPKHNAEIGGVFSSAHVDGNAADIKCLDGFARYKMVRAFYDAGFKRIGAAETFVHVDISTKPAHPQDVMWLYAKED